MTASKRLDQLDPRPASDGGSVYGVSQTTGNDASFAIGVPGGLGTLDADGVLAAAQRPPAFVPTFIPDGKSFTVPENTQALFVLPIVLGDGATLVVEGNLLEIAA